MSKGNRARVRSNNAFQKPINTIKPPRKADEVSSKIGPVLVGFFLFVVVGSALVQIFRTAEQAPNLGN